MQYKLIFTEDECHGHALHDCVYYYFDLASYESLQQIIEINIFK